MAMTVRQRHRLAHCYLLFVASSAVLQQLGRRGKGQGLGLLDVHEKHLISDINSHLGTSDNATTNTITNATGNYSFNASGIESEVEEEFEREVEEVEHVIENNPFKDAILESFLVICSSEFLDRSWVVSVLCMLQHGSIITCVGALPAFACHIALSACVGRFAQDVLTYAVLHIWGTTILALFGFHSLWECYHADPDKLAISARKRDSTMSDFGEPIAPITPTTQDARRRDRTWWRRVVNRHNVEDVSKVFVLVFRAEWGDATQLALVTLQTDEQQFAISCGSFMAFVAMLWAAAIVGSQLRAEQLRERPLLVLNCLTLWGFAAISGWQAWKHHAAAHVRHPSMVGTDPRRVLGVGWSW